MAGTITAEVTAVMLILPLEGAVGCLAVVPHMGSILRAADKTAANLAGKAANKAALQREFGLPVADAVPLFGNIGRLAEQKGVEILIAALREMLSAGFQFVAVGSGAPGYQRAYQDLARSYPSQVAVHIGFDEALSHRIEAGCDFFLMPSQYEPCGLNQLYSLRYGTIPIVRAIGGLDDSVIDLREDPFKANGIKFTEYSTAALAKAIRKALVLFQEPDLLRHMRINGMKARFSWKETATQYLEVYQKALESQATRREPARHLA